MTKKTGGRNKVTQTIWILRLKTQNMGRGKNKVIKTLPIKVQMMRNRNR